MHAGCCKTSRDGMMMMVWAGSVTQWSLGSSVLQSSGVAPQPPPLALLIALVSQPVLGSSGHVLLPSGNVPQTTFVTCPHCCTPSMHPAVLGLPVVGDWDVTVAAAHCQWSVYSMQEVYPVRNS